MKNIIMSLSMLLLVACKGKEQNEAANENADNAAIAENIIEKYCFLKVSPYSPEYNKDRVVNDSIVFEFEREGDSVYGVLKWLPYEKDTKRSTFRGVLKDGKGTAIAETMAEGMDYKEELHFTVEENSASIKYGAMQQDEESIWRYDKSETSEQVLEKVDCKE
ncbi:hypothetical protein [Flavobacterium sp.]|uniref:hypothetical protein n=1 Tax=Flavobacterium sp. TaxID=239 RepID=UPI0026186C86|nr:hypothetical protein [Flavobacterium sp.]